MFEFGGMAGINMMHLHTNTWHKATVDKQIKYTGFPGMWWEWSPLTSRIHQLVLVM